MAAAPGRAQWRASTMRIDLKLLLACAAALALAAPAAAAPVGGDSTLIDARGKRVSLRDYRGKVVLLYFGFVGCPDICPTDLMTIGKAVRALGRDALGVQPVFVTLDPKRDTRPILREYTRAFHPRFVALTGSEAQVRKVAEAYEVAFKKVPLAGGTGYTIDHTAGILIIGRDGRYVDTFPQGMPADRLARRLADVLN